MIINDPHEKYYIHNYLMESRAVKDSFVINFKLSVSRVNMKAQNSSDEKADRDILGDLYDIYYSNR